MAFQILTSRHFPDWLAEHNLSLAFSTYQNGKLMLVGRKEEGGIAVFERTFNRCMGLWSDTQTLWLAAAFQLWRLENVLAEDETFGGRADRLYVPQIGYTTGDIDIHDIAIRDDGSIIFVSTLFSCLATLGKARSSFEPVWLPPFISKLAAEDRCHLNGLAMRDGQPAFVTACSQTDIVDGWRDVRDSGGCVIDVGSGEVVAAGFSMPHSPRWYRDKLWMLDSGRGRFGYLDPGNGQFEEVAFCPGYARGLAFHKNFAIVGLSRPRHEPTFHGLPIEEEMKRRQAVPRAGLLVIDLDSGDARHWLRVEGDVDELYDVIALPGVVRPQAFGFKTEEIRHNTWFEENGEMRHFSGQPRE